MIALLRGIFAIIVTFFSGFLLCSIIWPKKEMNILSFLCKIFLSIGIGLGISSLTFFSVLILAGSINLTFTFIIDVLLLLLLSEMFLHVKESELPSVAVCPLNKTSKYLLFIFYLSLFLAMGIFFLRSLENPHGEPDAWYLWNSCARFLFRSRELWREQFMYGTWSHPDYPLLLPANVIRLWTYIGKETVIAPIMIAFLFTFATIGVLVSTLSLLRGYSQGLIGGIILTSTPYFIKHGASQYADVPLGFYILTVIFLFNLLDVVAARQPQIFCLIGICLGLAAWTKNEGLFLLGIVSVTYIFFKSILKRKRLKDTVTFFTGVLPILLILLYFKLSIAPSNDLVAMQGWQITLSRLTDLGRYFDTGKAFLRQLIEPYSLIYSTPLIIFLPYGLLLGVKFSQLKKSGVLTALLALLLMFVGYFFTYIMTPPELSWHLATSLSRLFLQLWPSTIFLSLMLINSPEER